MDVERKRETDSHSPDRGNGSAGRGRLVRRLFRDSEREADLEQAQAAVRQIEEAAAVKAAQIERLERAMKQVAGEEAPAAEPEAPQPEPEARGTHLVFVCAPGGYGLREAGGDVPGAGDRITLKGIEHVVAKVGRSPLPADDRRCAYLEPAWSPASGPPECRPGRRRSDLLVEVAGDGEVAVGETCSHDLVLGAEGPGVLDEPELILGRSGLTSSVRKQ